MLTQGLAHTHTLTKCLQAKDTSEWVEQWFGPAASLWRDKSAPGGVEGGGEGAGEIPQDVLDRQTRYFQELNCAARSSSSLVGSNSSTGTTPVASLTSPSASVESCTVADEPDSRTAGGKGAGMGGQAEMTVGRHGEALLAGVDFMDANLPSSPPSGWGDQKGGGRGSGGGRREEGGEAVGERNVTAGAVDEGVESRLRGFGQIHGLEGAAGDGSVMAVNRRDSCENRAADVFSRGPGAGRAAGERLASGTRWSDNGFETSPHAGAAKSPTYISPPPTDRLPISRRTRSGLDKIDNTAWQDALSQGSSAVELMKGVGTARGGN